MSSNEIDVILRTCVHCSPFCASWKQEYLTPGGVKYTGGGHAHRIFDHYHQEYDSGTESDDEKPEPTKIGASGDGNKTIKLVLLYTCNKVQPECHALPRNHGVADLEALVGQLQIFQGYQYQDEDDDNVPREASGHQRPFEVKNIDAEGEHFELTRDQWNKLRTEEGCIGCPLYMSVMTFHGKDFVDVKTVLGSLEIV